MIQGLILLRVILCSGFDYRHEYYEQEYKPAPLVSAAQCYYTARNGNVRNLEVTCCMCTTTV